MTGRNGVSLKASYARGCKHRTGRCTSLSKAQLIPSSWPAPSSFFGRERRVSESWGSLCRIIKISRLMKVCLLQFPAEWCVTLLDPTWPGCASQPCLCAEDRKYERCGEGLTFIKVSVSRIVWKPTALLYYTLHRSVPCSFFLVF